LTQVDWVNKYDPTREMVRIYWKNGMMASQGFIHNGKKEGPFVTNYPDKSKVMARGWDHNDSLDGEITIYYENGNIDKLMYFKDGKKVGVWKTFDSTGHIIDSTAY
jgi:antitoxin component YwqK of YwqJK toxin-antitoxin module